MYREMTCTYLHYSITFYEQEFKRFVREEMKSLLFLQTVQDLSLEDIKHQVAYFQYGQAEIFSLLWNILKAM